MMSARGENMEHCTLTVKNYGYGVVRRSAAMMVLLVNDYLLTHSRTTITLLESMGWVTNSFTVNKEFHLMTSSIQVSLGFTYISKKQQPIDLPQIAGAA